jgi:hypothetical protein
MKLTKEQAGRLANEDSMGYVYPVTGVRRLRSDETFEWFIYFHQRLPGWETSIGLLLASCRASEARELGPN